MIVKDCHIFAGLHIEILAIKFHMNSCVLSCVIRSFAFASSSCLKPSNNSMLIMIWVNLLVQTFIKMFYPLSS